MLHHLHDRKHLGVHTEMFSDGMVELVQAGIVTGERKTLHPGKIVASFVLGTRSLFDFIHDNPIVEFHPSDYVNDPFVRRNEPCDNHQQSAFSATAWPNNRDELSLLNRTVYAFECDYFPTARIESLAYISDVNTPCA